MFRVFGSPLPQSDYDPNKPYVIVNDVKLFTDPEFYSYLLQCLARESDEFRSDVLKLVKTGGWIS